MKRTCYECKSGAVGTRQNYAYAECGLKNVVLKDVVVYRCGTCGAISVDIPNMEDLHRTIALRILGKKSKLRADEIKFLRSVAGYTATDMARYLGVTKVAVSRWENNGKIGSQSDRAIRLFCGLVIVKETLEMEDFDAKAISESVSELRKLASEFSPERMLGEISPEPQDERLYIDPEVSPWARRPIPEAASLVQ